jgi:hypothetical protein
MCRYGRSSSFGIGINPAWNAIDVGLAAILGAVTAGVLYGARAAWASRWARVSLKCAPASFMGDLTDAPEQHPPDTKKPIFG